MLLVFAATRSTNIRRVMATSMSTTSLNNSTSPGETWTIVKSTKGKRKGKPKREMDFSLWNFRRVAFKIAYLGWNYSGMAVQDSTDETIEAKLFEGFMKTKLIQDHSSCHFTRCGRTDSGVSALNQVIALNVRSNLLEGPGVLVGREGCRVHERKGDKTTEIQYMLILNKVLPSDIRVLGYSYVHPDFNARFNCIQRMYKYFFPRGKMDIEVMQEAAKKLIGEHDFRNFCKMDIAGGVTHFRRRINNFTIKPLNASPEPSPYDMYEMTITGNAFLYHQIRCIAGILFLIGNGLEQPQLIDHMLDVEKCPGKPHYGMASDFPLILYDCIFEDVDWKKDEGVASTAQDHCCLCAEAYSKVVSDFQQLWSRKMIETTMVRRMLDSIQLPLLVSDSQSIPADHIKPVIAKENIKSHRPLLTRPVAGTLEDRLEYYRAKKRKLAESDDTD